MGPPQERWVLSSFPFRESRPNFLSKLRCSKENDGEQIPPNQKLETPNMITPPPQLFQKMTCVVMWLQKKLNKWRCKFKRMKQAMDAQDKDSKVGGSVRSPVTTHFHS